MAHKTSPDSTLPDANRLGLEQESAFFHGSPDPILVVSRRDEIRVVNRRAVEFFRKSESTLVSILLQDLFDFESRQRLDEMGSRGWNGVSENRLVLLDGRIVSLNGATILGDQEVSYLLTIRDESTRRALEHAREFQQKMDAVSRLSTLVATDLNDSISIVLGRLELMIELAAHEGKRESRHLAIALEHASRIAATLENLRLVGRTGPSKMHFVSLKEVFAQALALIGRRANRRKIEADFAELSLSGLAPTYARVFANVLGYVLDAVRSDDQVVVRAFEEEPSRVTIQMYGGPAVVSFDQLLAVPIQSARDCNMSNSFALDVARMLVEQFGGNLEEWRAGNSVIVKISVPSVSNIEDSLHEADLRVLFVGSRSKGEGLSEWIGLSGQQMKFSVSAELALNRIERGEPFDVVITEVFLPGMSGINMANSLARDKVHFNGKIVVLAEAPFSTPLQGVQVLSPPWSQSVLRRVLGILER